METVLSVIAISIISVLFFKGAPEKPPPKKDDDELVYKIEVKRPKPKS
ncbi:MAG: hypothetical protein SW833_00245 [Cyanobacteriota bacterium]|nr:hypothetical protein [Cyanobacteriota bacterium]